MDRTGDSRKNKLEVANETNFWSCILWSIVSSDPLFLIPSKEITGLGEGKLSTCPILQECPSSQTGSTIVVLFASRTPLHLWDSPNQVVPRLSGILPSGKFFLLQPWYFPGAAQLAQSHAAEPGCESRTVWLQTPSSSLSACAQPLWLL